MLIFGWYVINQHISYCSSNSWIKTVLLTIWLIYDFSHRWLSERTAFGGLRRHLGAFERYYRADTRVQCDQSVRDCESLGTLTEDTITWGLGPQEVGVDCLNFQKGPYRGFLRKRFNLVLRKECKTDGEGQTEGGRIPWTADQGLTNWENHGLQLQAGQLLGWGWGQPVSSSYRWRKIRMLPDSQEDVPLRKYNMGLYHLCLLG